MEEQILNTNELELKLENFEGPLDLLLHLVKEAKIEIKDIFISQVTDQFLVYMNQLSPEQEFIRNLEEYKKFKEISQKLKDIETVDRLYKPEDNSNKNVRFVAKDMSLDNLLDAFAKLLHKVGQKGADDGAKHIERDQFNVQDKIIFIQDALNKNQKITFSSLFDESVTKMEVVVTFSALLELLKFQYIFVSQSDSFEEIYIERNPDYQDVYISVEEEEVANNE